MIKGTNAPQIVIRCDASGTIGGGHAMRCLTLANTLASKGAEVTFVTAAMSGALAERITGAGHQIERIPASPELQREGSAWEEPPLSVEAQLVDAKMTVAAVGRANWIIVDHYLLDARWHSAVRTIADHVLVIDDLANRSYNCDILLDQTFGRLAENYRKLLLSGANILAGASYALLRPEFARVRTAALETRQASRAVNRVLISMGTADTGGISARVLDKVLAVAPDCAFDVVLSPQAPSVDHVHELAANLSGISVHLNSERMAELMCDADVAIGAAGTTSWERCCLGLPTIILVMANNQRLIAENLERAGAVVMADSPDTIAMHLRRLTEDDRMRHSMIAAAAAIVDGGGSDRVCRYMLGSQVFDPKQLRLRHAEASDRETLWLWRNDPVMRAMAKTHDPVIWTDHARWFARALNSERTTLYIADLRSDSAAMVRFDHEDGEVLVSINVAPSMRGKGVGTTALIRACEAYRRDHPSIALTAEIRHSNPASKDAFRAAGFEETDQGNAEISKFIRRGGTHKGAAVTS